MKLSIARLKEIIMEEVARATAIEDMNEYGLEEEVDLYPLTELEESLNIEIVDDE